jgi:hypothetical protein
MSCLGSQRLEFQDFVAFGISIGLLIHEGQQEGCVHCSFSVQSKVLPPE